MREQPLGRFAHIAIVRVHVEESARGELPDDPLRAGIENRLPASDATRYFCSPKIGCMYAASAR